MWYTEVIEFEINYIKLIYRGGMQNLIAYSFFNLRNFKSVLSNNGSKIPSSFFCYVIADFWKNSLIFAAYGKSTQMLKAFYKSCLTSTNMVSDFEWIWQQTEHCLRKWRRGLRKHLRWINQQGVLAQTSNVTSLW